MSDQLYSAYAQGRDLRRLEAIVGEGGLSDMDKKYLKVADRFENEFINQGQDDRSIEEIARSRLAHPRRRCRWTN